MTNIVVLIKQVPDTWSERKLSDGDWTLDREAADAVLDEINERAVEEALLIKEKEGGESTVTVLTAGPERATEAIRKALSMGADKGVHLLDERLHGSDMVQTGWALARALGTIEGSRSGDRRQRGHRRHRRCGPGHHRRVPGPAPADAHAQGHRRGRHDQRRARDRRRCVHRRGLAAGDRQRQREDQRAALPVLQGHHGRQEEGSGDPDPRRHRRRRPTRWAWPTRAPRC